MKLIMYSEGIAFILLSIALATLINDPVLGMVYGGVMVFVSARLFPFYSIERAGDE